MPKKKPHSGARSHKLAPKKSLAQFVLDKKREDCIICQLPADALTQLREASAKKIPRATQVEWLNDEYDSRITSADLDRHYSGRHDR